MRLLLLDHDGNLAWSEFSQDNLPPYGILSHTWGVGEVSFVDLTSGNAKKKASYRKILFCAEQAARDELRYFWIDNCCIDRRSSAELTKDINSMFRYYRGAVKCYVYLADVSCAVSNPSRDMWEGEFRESRWFRRGWTLQELLAPTVVEFYSAQQQRLGDKESLKPLIHDITRIPLAALSGHALDTFSVEQRMEWTLGRQTTEEEDGAYCLLGIFGIFMPLIYGEGKGNALRRLQRELDGIPATSMAKLNDKEYFTLLNPLVAGTHFIVPFERNAHFTGRDLLLAELESKLFTGEQTTRTAIVGLGGIGKTQIALELAYRTRKSYRNCSVFWIPATDADSFYQAYRDIAQRLSIPGWNDEKADVKKLVQVHLSQENARPWLCIYDNADDVNLWMASSDLGSGSETKTGGWKKFLPKSKQGCVLFTTRDKKAAVKLAGRDTIQVSELDEESAVQLLQKSLVESTESGDGVDAKRLVKELTYLPLAIVQAAAYINENTITIQDYLSLLNEQEEDVIELLSEDFEDDWRYQAIRNPVAKTWLISFDRIRNRNRLAADYLSFMACIDRTDIPQSLLPVGKTRKVEFEAMGVLQAYSFINVRGHSAVFDLHRLVHLAMRSWLRKEGELSRWQKAALQRLDDLLPSEEHKDRTQWIFLLPHAAAALRATDITDTDSTKLSVMAKYGMCLYYDGRYHDAEIAIRNVLALETRLLGEDHPDVLTAMFNLALIHGHNGHWSEAEELGTKVIEKRGQILGPHHPDTLAVTAKSVLLYTLQGQWQRAEALGKQTVEACRQALGPDHPITIDSMSNLAAAYAGQHRWSQAEVLQLHVASTNTRLLGAEHPDSLTSTADLAATYCQLKRWREAEEMFAHVLDTRRKLLGDEHPATLVGMGNLAATCAGQGRWSEAEALQIEALDVMGRVLGREHPDVLTTMNNLAVTRKEMGRLKAAVELMDECLQLRTRVLGPEHFDTVSSSERLASWRLEKLEVSGVHEE
jgi:tetratricopeptide (TPR) repeat protein